MDWADIIVEECAQTEEAKASSTLEIKSEGSIWDELKAEDLEDYRFECLYCDFKTLDEELWTAHVNYLHWSPQNEDEDVKPKLHEEIDLDENKATVFKNIDERESDENSSLGKEVNTYKGTNVDLGGNIITNDHREFNKDKSDKNDILQNEDFAEAAPVDIKMEGNNQIQDVQISKSGKLFFCEHCLYKSNQKQTVKNHVVLLHTAPEKIKWFHCDKCSYKCKLRRYLKRHVNQNHTEIVKLLHCEHCSFRTESKRQFRDHLKVQHIHQWFYCDASDEVTWFCCRHCTFRTKYKDSLKRHVLEVHAMRKEGH